MVKDTLMGKIDCILILSVKGTITIDTMLNFDSELYADVMCKQTFRIKHRSTVQTKISCNDNSTMILSPDKLLHSIF